MQEEALVMEKSSVVSVRKTLFLACKRTFDIFCSLIGLIMLLPVFFIVSIIIKIDSRGPVFLVQKRIGKNGKEFNFYKFRSMVPNADEVLKELLKDPKYKKEWDKNQKLDDDPRITKIGKIIRKISLDEVPQFINVFKGDMSLIGPRPLVEGELDAHNGNHEIYEKVKPGITGWWACNGRSATNYEERLKLEYYYAENASLSLDIKCIFRTIKAVISRTGAK